MPARVQGYAPRVADDYLKRFDGLPTRELDGGRTLVEARTHRSRRRGLAKLDSLPPDHALHIAPCRSIHMFGMRFPLDLIWLDSNGEVVRIDRDVPVGRIRSCLRARSVIETVSGEGDAFADALRS